MAYEMKDNSFSIFTNGRKSKDTDCDFNGTLKVNGVEYWINSWAKDNNGLVMSGTVKPKQYSGAPVNKPAEPAENYNPLDEDLPF